MIFEIIEHISPVQGAFILYELPEPIVNFDKFTSFVDDVESSSVTSVIKREFAWSNDGDVFSNYIKLTNANLINIPSGVDKLYMKFKYTKIDSQPIAITVNAIQLEYQTLAVDDESCEPVSEKVEGYLGLEINECENDDAFQLSEGAADLEQMLNFLANARYGTDVIYFRTEPEKGKVDSYLNEYSLHNTVEQKCIKIVIPDNEIPEPKPEYTEWDIMFEEFQIHIDKAYWETHFTHETKPRVEDYIHFKHFGRLYRVSSVMLDRGTMDKGTYYILELKVYDDNTAVSKSDEIEDYIDNITISHEEIFRDEQILEEENITNPKQGVRHNISDENDTREHIDEDVVIADECIINNGTVITDNHYDFTQFIDPINKARIGVGGLEQNETQGLMGDVGVIYKDDITFCKGDDIGFSFWIKPIDRKLDYLPFEVTASEKIDRYKSITTIDKDITTSMIQKGGYITNGIKIYSVEDITEDGKLIIYNQNDVDLGEYKFMASTNIISAYNNHEGIDIVMLDYRYVVLRFNKQFYTFDMYGAELRDKWLGGVINLSTKYNYAEASLYELVNRTGYPDKYSTILNGLKKSTITIDSTDFKLFTNKAYLKASYHYITNIRIWKRAIPDESHNKVLNSKVVTNSSMAWVIDNARPLFNMLNLGEGAQHR